MEEGKCEVYLFFCTGDSDDCTVIWTVFVCSPCSGCCCWRWASSV